MCGIVSRPLSGPTPDASCTLVLGLHTQRDQTTGHTRRYFAVWAFELKALDLREPLGAPRHRRNNRFTTATLDFQFHPFLPPPAHHRQDDSEVTWIRANQ